MKIVTRAIRQQRREQAIKRQERYDALSKEEKLEIIRQRRGNSVRELKRLGA